MKCETCKHGIFCYTWGEWKCSKKERRVYDKEEAENCESYEKDTGSVNDKSCRCTTCDEEGGFEDD